ncbi:TNT domain-containing protein [Actinokineospora iranica]|uniref:TNT domain-containing protein n=1 Tax=Actinokineospora iranica TaxID=1271860 RepID=A0A1G6JVV2_9PSEU|nr:TNT domain-containing protein [Actinokineospora iranica]SDC22788.1 Protein of unknown function [Actinokineospora iranica]
MERQEPLDSLQQQNVQQQIAALLVAGLPEGWERLDVEFRAVGNHSELSWQAYGANGVLLSWKPPAQLGAAFARLREAMRAPGAGSWFSVLFRLKPPGDYESSFNYNDVPRWRDEPSAADYALDRDLFPRDAARTPEWFSRRIEVLRRRQFREARVFDALPTDMRPVVDRAPVPADEITPVLNYLENAPFVLVERGFEVDLIDGSQGPPAALRTDGTWIWSTDVAYYLRKHGIPPEPDLVAHIRQQDFTVPAVDEETVLHAEAAVTGVEKVQQLVEFRFDYQDEVQLDNLRRRLNEYGVSPNAYLIRKHADLFWCLERVEAGWQVAYYKDGQPVDPVVHEKFATAAEHLLGKLLIDPERARARAPKIRQTQAVLDDWPIQPSGGEPPLTLYADKRMIVLVPGTYLVRYGSPAGNLTFAEGTEFPATSLRQDWAARGPRKYRVQRPLQVLTGTTVPWHDQPGGGTAYLLPRSVDQHLGAGSLAEAQ